MAGTDETKELSSEENLARLNHLVGKMCEIAILRDDGTLFMGFDSGVALSVTANRIVWYKVQGQSDFGPH
jgi:hypothetical protein